MEAIVIMRDLGQPPDMAQRYSCNEVNSIVAGYLCQTTLGVAPDNKRAHPSNERGARPGEEAMKEGSAMQPGMKGEGRNEERKEGSAMQPQEKE